MGLAFGLQSWPRRAARALVGGAGSRGVTAETESPPDGGILQARPELWLQSLAACSLSAEPSGQRRSQHANQLALAASTSANYN